MALWSGPAATPGRLASAWKLRGDTHIEETSATEGRTAWRRDGSHAALLAPAVVPTSATFRLTYREHQAHLLSADADRDWLLGQTNCLLITQPATVLATLASTGRAVRPEDTGLPQQVEIFHHIFERTGVAPIVIDASDLLNDTERTLRAWCGRVGVEFLPAMLAGVASGSRDRMPRPGLPASLRSVWAVCQPLYDQLYAERV
ncbi:MAG: hypothetical protein AAGJ46_16970 [Planctomycetota bacterium]